MSVGRKMKDWTICCCWFLLVCWRLHRETLDLGGKKSLNPRGVLKWTLLQGNYFYIWKDKMSFLAGSVFDLAWSSVRTSVKSHTHTKRCNLWPPKLVIFNRYIDLFLSILLKLSNNDFYHLQKQTKYSQSFCFLKFEIYKPVFVFGMSCSINNKLQQPEAASGVLDYAMKHFSELVSIYYIYFI